MTKVSKKKTIKKIKKVNSSKEIFKNFVKDIKDIKDKKQYSGEILHNGVYKKSPSIKVLSEEKQRKLLAEFDMEFIKLVQKYVDKKTSAFLGVAGVLEVVGADHIYQKNIANLDGVNVNRIRNIAACVTSGVLTLVSKLKDFEESFRQNNS